MKKLWELDTIYGGNTKDFEKYIENNRGSLRADEVDELRRLRKDNLSFVRTLSLMNIAGTLRDLSKKLVVEFDDKPFPSNHILFDRKNIKQ